MKLDNEKSQDFKPSLFDFCNYNTSLTDGENSFVGIKYENEKLQINFPVGYSKAATEEELKKDILNLISVLSSIGESNEGIINSENFAKKENVIFPIHAYLFLIKDFLTSGYYFEKEVKYTKSQSGKINWSKTVKQIRPTLINENVFYFDFITRKTEHNENELISQIHQYCVHESFSKIGWLFSSFVPPKPQISFNKNLFLAVIKTKFSQTFNEKNLVLFNYMIQIIEYLDKSNESNFFSYGTNNFAYIWEVMVDRIFGEKDKSKYYPHCYWEIDGSEKKSVEQLGCTKSALRPDSIMITNRNTAEQKIFVLDSKYYRYGESKNPVHLPMSASIIKQIAYAQFIERLENEGKLKSKSKAIYNAFIMPFDSKDTDVKIKYIASASTDYISEEKSYSKISAILFDTKTLMQNHFHDDKLISQLAELIEKQR